MRTAALTWSVGIYCVILGASALVLVGQLQWGTQGLGRSVVPWWGATVIVAGLALAVTAAGRVPRWVEVAAHLFAALVLIALGWSTAFGGIWTVSVNNGVIAVATLIAPFIRPGGGTARKTVGRDLLAVALGTTAIIVGASALIVPIPFRQSTHGLVQFHPLIGGVVFLVVGIVLTASQFNFPRLGSSQLSLPRGHTLAPEAIDWVAHALAAIAYLGIFFIVAAPGRVWTGIAFYGWFGMALLLFPWVNAEVPLENRRSLRVLTTWILIASSILPLVLLTVLIVNQENQRSVQSALRRQRAEATVSAEAVETYLDLQAASLRALATPSVFQAQDSAAQGVALRSFMSKYPDLLAVATYASNGQPIAWSNEQSLVGSGDASLFHSILSSGTWSADALVLPGTSQPVIVVGAPIRSASGQPVGVVVALLSPVSINALLARIAGSDHETFFLANRRGQIIASTENPRLRVDVNSSALAPVQALLTRPGQDGALRYEYQGTDWFGGYAPVVGTSLGIVSNVSGSVGLAGARDDTTVAFDLLLLLGAIMGVVGIAVGGWLGRPLRILTHAAERYAVEDDSVILPSSGVAEVQSLLSSFAAMRERLTQRTNERDRAEASLRATEQRFATAFRSSPWPMAIVRSTDHQIVDANDRMLELAGQPRDEVVGHSPDEVGIWIDPEMREEVLGRFRKERRVERLEVPVRSSKGEPRTLLLSIEPIELSGEPASLILINDLTERKRMEEALRESNRRLEDALVTLRRTQLQVAERERLRALGQMASGIAHDVNNALAQIVGYGELLLVVRPRDLENPEKVRTYLQYMYTAAQDAASVVQRLREFYRVRAPADDFVAVDLAQVVEQSVELTRPRWHDQALGSGATIAMKVEIEQTGPVSGNEANLREVLTNLIFNAVDAMPSGGELTIRVAGAEDNRVLLQVKDTGVGMTDEVRAQCLEPFFTTKGPTGSGLGLSVVFGILQRHGATLDIASAVGEGTTISIAFEALVATPTTLGEPREVASPLPPMRVLVVDDEASVRDILRSYLIEDGHVVDSAANGREGMAAFGTGQYDVVVTDRAMPELSGDQLAREIKQQSPDQRIVLLTGFGDLIVANGERVPGVDVVASKPISRDDLRRAIARALERDDRRQTVAVARKLDIP